MKKILVPTDFSDNAFNAVNYAISIAKILQGSITLLHTFQSPHPTGVLRSMDPVLEQDAENEMSALVQQLLSSFPVNYEIAKGEPVYTIAAYAEREGFDLIVMGTQGASGMKEAFLGSVTGGVMRRTQIPILAVPKGYNFRPLENIGFAVASLQLYTAEATRLVRELVHEFNARMFVFHQSDSMEAEVEVPSNLDWMGDIPYTVSIVNNGKDLETNIHDFVDKKGIGLLCMVRRKRAFTGFFERLLKDSATLTHVFHCKIPLLILHSE